MKALNLIPLMLLSISALAGGYEYERGQVIEEKMNGVVISSQEIMKIIDTVRHDFVKDTDSSTKHALIKQTVPELKYFLATLNEDGDRILSKVECVDQKDKEQVGLHVLDSNNPINSDLVEIQFKCTDGKIISQRHLKQNRLEQNSYAIRAFYLQGEQLEVLDEKELSLQSIGKKTHFLDVGHVKEAFYSNESDPETLGRFLDNVGEALSKANPLNLTVIDRQEYERIDFNKGRTLLISRKWRVSFDMRPVYFRWVDTAELDKILNDPKNVAENNQRDPAALVMEEVFSSVKDLFSSNDDERRVDSQPIDAEESSRGARSGSR